MVSKEGNESIPIQLRSWGRQSGHREDAVWLLSNAFLVITMQTGFAMLEAGCVTAKNVTHIMVKNLVDVAFGGFAYWAYGYALSFGEPSNPFFGTGNFFATAPNDQVMGTFYSNYFFQFSLASSSTTILSGAVAERMKLGSYMIHSLLSVFIYSVPVSWTWGPRGFLRNWGYYDFAGASVVHISGGSSALIAILIIGPRSGRFTEQKEFKMSSPVTALTGTFMLWWAWLAFNCGASYGISGSMWKIAAKAAVTTLNGSIGGSLTGLIMSVILTWDRGQYYFQIEHLIPSILGGLIAVTASCPIITPTESVFVGAIGGFLAIAFTGLLLKAHIDDPIGAVAIHLGTAFWSVISVALIGSDDFDLLGGNKGVLKGGTLKFLGIQVAGALIIASWSGILTALSFIAIKKTVGLRMDLESEYWGADWMDHRVLSEFVSPSISSDFDAAGQLSRCQSVATTPTSRQFSDPNNPPASNWTLKQRTEPKVHFNTESDCGGGPDSGPSVSSRQDSVSSQIYLIPSNLHRYVVQSEQRMLPGTNNAGMPYPNIPMRLDTTD